MLKGKKPSEETGQRLKLPLEAGIRPLSGIKELLATAEASRGQQVELGWTTGTSGQAFVLDVQWDTNADDPVWSLYEENDSGSVKLWSQHFAVADIELLYDVLAMSCKVAAPSNKLSDILKSKLPKDKEDQSKSAIGEASQDNKKSQPDPKNDYSLNINPDPSSEPPGATIPAASQPPQYNMPPGMGGFSVSYSPVMVPGQGYMIPPAMPPPGWTFAPIPAGNAGNISPMLPANPYAQQPTAPVSQPAGEPLSALPIDSTLVNKRYDISLADLLKQADLLSKPTIAAALKMQTMVQAGKLPVDEAVKILKQYHQEGESIDTYIGSAASASAPEHRAKNTSTASTGKAKPLSKEKAAAFELLENAGLLSKDDIATAKNVSRKHGGDLVSILKAAHKLDDKTLEAAIICAGLLSEEQMKLGECVITLNYCSRSRVGFDEAMVDLNWPNPRKK